MKVRFYLTNAKAPQPVVMASLAYRKNAPRFNYSTGIVCQVAMWQSAFNVENGRFEGRGFKNQNDVLTKIEKAIVLVYTRFEVNGRLSELNNRVMKEAVDLEYKGIAPPSVKSTSLIDFWETLVRTKVGIGHLADSSFGKYNENLLLFRGYMAHKGLKDVSFEGVNNYLFDDYVVYLKTVKGYQYNTLSTTKSIFCSVMNIARKQLHHQNLAFLTFELPMTKKVKKQFAYLIPDEVLLFEKVDLSHLPPQYYRAWLVSMCMILNFNSKVVRLKVGFLKHHRP